ncbi:Zn-dependent hydrolase [candidate division KSB1 bacterium 4484_87]|nr:MAG: Zn-dependent hydrolase [candidate division KSB1 bacterium 4484_87]
MIVDFIHWLGHDSFLIKDSDKILYIDPWKLPTNSPKADYIFVTHSHYDHFSHPDIEKIRKIDTKIIAPVDVTDKLSGNALPLKPNQTIRLDSLAVEAVPAYNIDKTFHPKEKEWLGFIIQLSGGLKIYHAGDTDFIPEMKNIKAQIALLPVSGTYVMTAAEAAAAANTFRPEVVIPMHFGDIVGSEADAEMFQKAFQGETIIKKAEK